MAYNLLSKDTDHCSISFPIPLQPQMAKVAAFSMDVGSLDILSEDL